MARKDKFGLATLRKEFPTDDAILHFIFTARHSEECSCGGSYRRIPNRKQYQCSKCRYQIAPLAGTIFNKSDTPLTLWFHAIMVFSNAKSGMSAKALERDLEVTYKTAWRMLKLIREALGQDDEKLKGDKGTHKHVSAKHLQSYLDGFVFHANNRGNDSDRFYALLGALLLSSKSGVRA